MAPVWEAIQQRLEARGLENRGRVRVPPLGASARRTLTALLQHPLTSQIDLARVEAELQRQGVGDDLAAALAALGFPVSDEPARRRAESAAGREARAAARAEAASWTEEWASEWIDGVIKAGALRRLDRDEAVGVVKGARRVLDAIDERATRIDLPLSRVELAAQILGDAHALDTGRRVEVAVSRALALRAGPVDPRQVWEEAGVHLDLTSGPALTWNLPHRSGSGLGALCAAATAAGVPVHLSRMALEAHPLSCSDGADVLVVENPRIVEAAAQRRSPLALVSAGGSPSGAVQLLIRQLISSGATVRYHGDFDSAGLVLCGRMAAIGAVPWRMTTADYRSALVDADEQGVSLPEELTPPPPTPWDPQLQEAFERERRIVHEERLLPELLDP